MERKVFLFSHTTKISNTKNQLTIQKLKFNCGLYTHDEILTVLRGGVTGHSRESHPPGQTKRVKEYSGGQLRVVYYLCVVHNLLTPLTCVHRKSIVEAIVLPRALDRQSVSSVNRLSIRLNTFQYANHIPIGPLR